MVDVLPSAPVFLGDHRALMRFYAYARRPGDPPTTIGTFTLDSEDAVVVLNALKGDKGEPGTPSPIIRPQWGHGYTSVAQLHAAENTLNATDAGRAWYIGGTWNIWTGSAWRQEQGSLDGPPGPTPDLSMSAEVIAPSVSGPYGEILVDRSGTDEDPHFHLKIPGIPGPQGDNSTIRGSLDYDNSVDPLDGQGLVWSATKNKFEPGDSSPLASQMWSIPQGAFQTGTFTDPEKIIAQLTIEAQPHAWWPDVSGHLRWRRSILSTAQVHFEVRIENENTSPSVPGQAPMVGLGPYNPSISLTDMTVDIDGHFSYDGDPMRAVSPTSAAGRIPAGQAVNVFVVARRIAGSGGYIVSNEWAQLIVRGHPVS
ncbi:hypothetical protein [Mycobacteroides abscessus]|uniref:hypothetical protein n=1 Tax=Mycobacteroides abscessus TaxID=36809 RepID=UPI0005E90D4E|nr:hypothetical protein [Mycobacteroides abscessus]CPR79137.1 Bacteriophage minor tail subunit [Mycobacteroides abscessus]CPR88302.1 Bacteriophage minor tail subunit [Mycobacteroides abscessus]CPS43251.1 Bacteriophage minor tail subunit [Mycobacteroides abscessus]CPV03038.1 Bacteriophage minor tail subunit [Mycobacteroides abscessus]